MDPGRLYKGPVDPIPPLGRVDGREVHWTQAHHDILEYLRRRGPRARVSFDEIARHLGLPEEILHRHLADLHESGHVDRDHPHYWTA